VLCCLLLGCVCINLRVSFELPVVLSFLFLCLFLGLFVVAAVRSGMIAAAVIVFAADSAA